MKNIKYIFFALIILFISIFHVQASCNNEELSILKEKAEKIKITYKHLGKVEDEEGVFYNRFQVNVKNIPDDFYILTLYNTIRLEPQGQTIEEVFNNGTWYFDIYSNKCDEMINQIKVYIPKFNEYSLDPMCEGINSDDFPLCRKYYEYADNITYNEFETRVKNYRITNNITNIDEQEKKEDTNIIIQRILNLITEYRLYLISSLLILLLILIVIIIIKKKRNRGVLE